MTPRTKAALRRCMASPRVVVGSVLALVVVLVAAFAPWLAPHDPTNQDLLYTLLPPTWAPGGEAEYLLGTDSLGRCILSRLIYGSRVAVYVAILSATGAMLLGTMLALLAGYFGGRVDWLIGRAVDVWMAFPPVVLALILLVGLGTGVNKVILAIIIIDWTRFCRVIRSEVLVVMKRDYIPAARLVGFSHAQVILKELLPAVMPLLITLLSLEMGIAVIVEATMSFVGDKYKIVFDPRIEAMIRSELDAVLARPRYARQRTGAPEVNPPTGVPGHRHGSRTRTLMGTFGPTEIRVPRARLHAAPGSTTEWKSTVLRAYQRRTLAADALIASTYLSGTNTRRVRRALAALFGGAVSKDTVSRVWRKVKSDWDVWNARPLDEHIVRLILDGTVVRVRLDRTATSISLLVVIGVREDGQKVLLSIRSMGGETTEAWRAVLDDLVQRGLRRPQFLITDGAPGLLKALAAVWDGVPIQRCTVHKHRNLLGSCSRASARGDQCRRHGHDVCRVCRGGAGTAKGISAQVAAAPPGFVGLSVETDVAAWGVMIADARQFMHQAPWGVVLPMLAIFTTVLAFNLLGDGLRRVLDPRLLIARGAIA